MQKTISAITKLELVLQSKLELFSCQICEEDDDDCKFCLRNREDEE